MVTYLKAVCRSVAVTVVAAALASSAWAAGPPTLLEWYSTGTSESGSKLDEPLITDRPDFTESPTTVGQGVLQLEMGYTFSSDSSQGVRTTNHSFPETLLRVGVLADWFELRTVWNYESERTRTGGIAENESGANDLILGCKIALTGQQGYLPEVGLILQMSVPSGGSAFTSDEVLPGFNLCYAWDLSEDTYLAGSTGINGTVDDETRDLCSELNQSLSLGHMWTEKLGNYAEWFVLSPISADTNRPEHYFNGGFTYLFNKDVQWDIRAGVGLNEAADNFFVGTGLSVRYY